MRRLRQSEKIRNLVAETRLHPDQFILPIFFDENIDKVKTTGSMPGVKTFPLSGYDKIASDIQDSGVNSVLVFGVPAHKDAVGSGAYARDGVVQKAIEGIKENSDMLVIADLCLCEYTDHGHCGILRGHEVDNDATVEVLARIALSHVEAGADMVAPSDMMDGRIAAIRALLDENGHENTPILSYAAKYASAFYGPFREAAGSAPAFGDRRGYQMDPHNVREALRECALDVEEGTDILMVKPALAYLDVISRVKERFDLPVCAYAVSGEYAMVKAAAAAGLVDEHRIMCESAVAVYRAGADLLITYYALELADAMRRGELG
jgi:porphobilinogen synthase